MFSRISARLHKVNCFTLETFVSVVAEAYSPAPQVEALTETIDFQSWLSPHFYKEVKGITEPHQFHITRTTDTSKFPTGTCIRAQLYSDSPPNEPWSVLKTLPSGIPDVKAGRALFYRTAGTEDQFATDWENFCKQIKNFKLYPHQQESWSRLISNLDEWQKRPSHQYEYWFPESTEEVVELLQSFQYEPSPEGKGRLEHGCSSPVPLWLDPRDQH